MAVQATSVVAGDPTCQGAHGFSRIGTFSLIGTFGAGPMPNLHVSLLPVAKSLQPAAPAATQQLLGGCTCLRKKQAPMSMMERHELTWTENGRLYRKVSNTLRKPPSGCKTFLASPGHCRNHTHTKTWTRAQSLLSIYSEASPQSLFVETAMVTGCSLRLCWARTLADPLAVLKLWEWAVGD